MSDYLCTKFARRANLDTSSLTPIFPRGRIAMISKLAVLVVLLLAAGRPPIIDAVRKGDRDALRSLIAKGTNVNEAEADGATALHWASIPGRPSGCQRATQGRSQSEHGQRSRRDGTLDRQSER